MVALKGKPDIGDQINKKILGPLAQANKLSDMPDFNDPNKLGGGCLLGYTIQESPRILRFQCYERGIEAKINVSF